MNRQERDAAFEAYVSVHRPRLRRLAYTLCGDWYAADDAVQTALAKLYVVWPRVVRARNEDAYVRRTVTRCVVDQYRRPWRRERSGLDDLERPGPSTGAPDPGDRVVLVAALQQLPERQRAVVVLRHWWGLSVAETAHDLRLSEGTVKSHTSRALTRLHELMNDTDGASR